MTEVKYISRVATPRNKASFSNSVKSNLLKLWYSRGNKISMSIGVLGYATIFTIGLLNFNGAPSLSFYTAAWKMIGLFMVILGISASANEYSHNTMRNTTLSDPVRVRNFFAKLTAVGIYSTVVSVILSLLGIASYQLFAQTNQPVQQADLIALGYFCVVLILLTILGTAIGYLVRSTAAGIGIATFLMLVIEVLTLIPLDFFREELSRFFLSRLVDSVVLPEHMSAIILPEFSQGTSLLLFFFIYPLMFTILGLIRYLKTDI